MEKKRIQNTHMWSNHLTKMPKQLKMGGKMPKQLKMSPQKMGIRKTRYPYPMERKK